MDVQIKEKFTTLWRNYFKDTELPITFYYTDNEGDAELIKPSTTHRCIVKDLSRVRKGHSLCFNIDSIGCFGGRRYLGFADKVTPQFEELFSSFLSCGVPGQIQGERYKKSPEIVKQWLKHSPQFKAPARFIVFKRWDMLQESDRPEVVIFFAQPDVLAGLFTLANFDQAEPNGVFAPFCAGCASVVQYPYLEGKSQHPRGVIGMFDISARPFLPKDVLTFAVPVNKFSQMVANMEESFLITDSWKRVQKRIISAR